MSKIKLFTCALVFLCQCHIFAQKKKGVVYTPPPISKGLQKQREICLNCAERYFFGGKDILSKHFRIVFVQQKVKIPSQGNIEINFELDTFGIATGFRIVSYDHLSDSIAQLILSSTAKIDRWEPVCEYGYGNGKIVCVSKTLKLCLFFKNEKIKFLFDNSEQE